MDLLLTLISALIKILIIYFFVFALTGLTKPFEKLPEASSVRRFAVILPVRNEEKVIGKLIESLNEADYPKDKLEVWAVLNNSSDRSGEIAASQGANVMIVDIPVHSKGDALSFAFDKLAGRSDIDAYAVFDTDNVVDPGFFREMNKKLEAGGNIIQGRRVGKNAAENILTGCYEIFYTMQNVYFNHARTAMGRSGSLNGTAWVVRKSWIDENGFKMKTMTEDLELTAVAALKGEHIAYAHQALSYDEYPSRIRVALRQLLRWSVGQVQCMRAYSADLTKKFLTTGSVSSLNIDLVFLAPVMLVSLAAIFIIFTFTRAQAYHLPLPWRPSEGALTVILIIGFYAMCYGARLKCGRDVKIPLLSNAAFPFFLIMWLPLMVRSLFMKEIEWKPVVHDHAVGIDEIEKRTEQILYDEQTRCGHDNTFNDKRKKDPKMSDDLKKALSYTAFGALFTLVNFNLIFNGASINIMPDFIGWILFFLACGKLGSYLEGKGWLKGMALLLVILSLAVWLGEILKPELDISVLETVVTAISTAYMFILFGPLEQLARDYGSSRAGTIRTLKYINLAAGAVLLATGLLLSIGTIRVNGPVAILFTIAGIVALAAAIVTMVVLFRLRKELSEKA